MCYGNRIPQYFLRATLILQDSLIALEINGISDYLC